jgi:8-oxo-dGTP pyrophosphatase MutT (NUDIX family)
MNYTEFIAKVLAISRIGLKFSKDEYALENYTELQALASEQLKDEHGFTDIDIPYQKDIYPTPSISVRVIVFNDQGQLLMGQEKSDGGYAVPGGWCDLFESPTEAAVKEVLQETGLHVRIDRMLALLRRDLYRISPALISEYVLYFKATIVGGTLKPNHEILQVGFFDLDKLPQTSRKMTLPELNKALDVALHHDQPVVD